MPVLGAGIGLLLRYVIPGRQTYGLLLNPALGACATAITWVLLFVNEWSLDEPWIWVLSLVAAVVVCTIVPLVLQASRPRSDERRLERLLTPTA